MSVFIRDLSGTAMLVGTKIMPQAAVHVTILIGREHSKNSQLWHQCTTTLHILYEIARSAEAAVVQ